MWCVPELNREYIDRMEAILDLLAEAPSQRMPVLALDERPVQLHDSKRAGISVKRSKPARYDYEYVRRGTANIFCIVAPKLGKHFTRATKRRKGGDFARELARLSKSYPRAKKIRLIMDNLSTHSERSLTKTFGEKEGRRLWRRFEVFYTPKHASWLNPAEIEVGLWSRQCLGKRRISDLDELKRETVMWNRRANRNQTKISWRFRTTDARRIFKYRKSEMPRSEH